MKKGTSALLGLLCLAAPSLATYDPFTPDTTILSGEQTIPCETFSKTTSYDGEEGSCRYFQDEDERLIAYVDTFFYMSNGDTIGGGTGTYSVEVDAEGKINKELYNSTSGGPNHSASFNSVLEAVEWNSAGCISEGIYKSTRSVSAGPKPSVTKEVQLVGITYDQSGTKVVSKEILDSTYFIADTVITAGEYDISVEVERRDGFNGKIGLSTSGYCYTDSIDRVISRYGKDSYQGLGGTYEGDFKVEIDHRSRFLTENFHCIRVDPDTSEFESKLMALEWNENGKITSGLMYRKGVIANPGGFHGTFDDTVLVQYTYREDGYKLDSTVTERGDFKADTVILAGDIPVSCRAEIRDTDSTGQAVIYASYTDSLGRIIKQQDDIEVENGASGKRDRFSVFLDSENRITQVNSFWNTTGSSHSSTVKDTLVGESWNEWGMILDGTIYRMSKSYSKYSNGTPKYDTSLVTLVYDATGINAIDTLSRESVSILDKVTASKEMTLSQNGRIFSLENFTAGESVKLFSANGRLIQTVHTNGFGAAQLDLSSYPAGIYFLKSMKMTQKLLCR